MPSTKSIGRYDREVAFEVARALAPEVGTSEVWILPNVQRMDGVDNYWYVTFEVIKCSPGYAVPGGVLIDERMMGKEIVDMNSTLDRLVRDQQREFV